MSKSFAMDDEHWITINGNHVLINGEGEVQAGMGGALKGVKLSKPKSNMRGKLSSAKKEYEQHDKKFGARYKSEFDRHNRALERIDKEQKRLDKEHENDWQEKDRDTYMKKRSELRNAEAELDRKKRDEDDKNESKLKQIGERSGYEKRGIYLKKEGVKKALSSARSKLKSAREANAYMKERGTKVSKATLEMAGGKFRNRSEELDRIGERWNKSAKRLEREEEKIDKQYEEALSKYNTNPAGYFKSYKRLKSLNPEKYKGLMNRIKDKVEHVTKQRDLLAEKADLQTARAREEARKRDAQTDKEWNKTFKENMKAKKALAKARPKIAERRQAIRKYNEREDEKLAKAMGLGKYRKPYYETDSFKSGRKSGDSNV